MRPNELESLRADIQLMLHENTKLKKHVAELEEQLTLIYRVALSGQEALRSLGAKVEPIAVPPSIARRKVATGPNLRQKGAA